VTGEQESSELTRALRHAEQDVARQDRETVYILRPDGALAYYGVGERDQVFIPRDAIRGNIVVHNHPGGGSLSRRDVQVLLERGAAQMRVVTRDWVYVLDRPLDPVWEDVDELVRILMDQVDEQHQAQILAGQLTHEEAEVRRWHEIWTGVAEIRGWAYRREPRTSG
jgi:hypothetical protein